MRVRTSRARQRARLILGHPKRQEGYNLLEVLVALVVLSVGLLGLAGLQLQGLQGSQSAYLRSQASLQAYDMVDRIRANHRCIRETNCPYFNLEGVGDDQGCNHSFCDVIEMAEHDRYEWNTANAERLPGGEGTVTRIDAGTSLYEITVTWDEERIPDAEAEFTYWAIIEP